MPADVRDLTRVRFEFFCCDDGSAVDGGLSYHERIGDQTALEQFLRFNVLLKMRDAVNSPNEVGLVGRRHTKHVRVEFAQSLRSASELPAISRATSRQDEIWPLSISASKFAQSVGNTER